MDWFIDAPKTELHIHLEGATNFDTYLAISKKNNISLPFKTVEEATQLFRCSSLSEFLYLFRDCISVIHNPSDFVILMNEFVKDRQAQNIKYCEFFISLSSYMTHDLDPNLILTTISACCQQAEQQGVELRCIPDISRERTFSVAQKCMDAIIANRCKYIVGVGLGGAEDNGCKRFAELFARADSMGLKIVAHAGETRDSLIVWEAINDLKVARIGHGIAAAYDTALMDYLKVSRIPLEVCPTSNYYTGLIPKGERHPVHQMIKHGLNITINSDDPVMFNTTLNKELQSLKAEGASDYVILTILSNSILASFMPEPQKRHYTDMLYGHYIKNCTPTYKE